MGERVRVENAMSSEAFEAEFDVHKAIASVAFLVAHTGATMYSVLKMLYLADKTHLERYGRFISGDRYAAMKQGPVPSFTYNMIKHARGEKAHRVGDEVAREYLECNPETHEISIRQAPDYEELSETDIECLEEVVGLFKRLGPWAIRDMSHDDPWKKAWRPNLPFRLKKSVPMPIEIIAGDVDETGALVEHLRDPHPGWAERTGGESGS